MIHYCKGIVTSVEASKGEIVLEIGETLGLRFFCTRKLIETAEENSALFLYVHLQTMEDVGFLLFGFADEYERALFSMLTSVRGVGSRMAMMIMSSLAVPEILHAILESDLQILTSLPGIGKKISERLCFELSEKVHKHFGPTFNSEISSHPGTSLKNRTGKNHVFEALLSLGFARKEALRALEAVQKEDPSLSGEETLLKAALRRLQP